MIFLSSALYIFEQYVLCLTELIFTKQLHGFNFRFFSQAFIDVFINASTTFRISKFLEIFHFFKNRGLWGVIQVRFFFCSVRTLKLKTLRSVQSLSPPNEYNKTVWYSFFLLFLCIKFNSLSFQYAQDQFQQPPFIARKTAITFRVFPSPSASVFRIELNVR